MTNGIKLLLMAAGAIIICILVMVGLQITKNGNSDTSKAMTTYEEVNEYDEIKDLDGRNILGSVVKSLINEYQEEQIYFLVKTNESEAILGTYYNRAEDMTLAGTYNNADKTSSDYINDYGQFMCSIKQNANGIVIGLIFVQKE